MGLGLGLGVGVRVRVRVGVRIRVRVSETGETRLRIGRSCLVAFRMACREGRGSCRG